MKDNKKKKQQRDRASASFRKQKKKKMTWQVTNIWIDLLSSTVDDVFVSLIATIVTS